jgi:hypothetical protein
VAGKTFSSWPATKSSVAAIDAGTISRNPGHDQGCASRATAAASGGWLMSPRAAPSAVSICLASSAFAGSRFVATLTSSQIGLAPNARIAATAPGRLTFDVGELELLQRD